MKLESKKKSENLNTYRDIQHTIFLTQLYVAERMQQVGSDAKVRFNTSQVSVATSFRTVRIVVLADPCP